MKTIISELGLHKLIVDGKEVARVAYIAHEDCWYCNATNTWWDCTDDQAKEWAHQILETRY